ncbi:pyridoxine 5'-phosphate synthase [Rhizobium sp. SL42]|uniref:pyridoxine 5'-phosphate synthase n=1 Tax=Rhizobium sp. SL42 TaxID=2806346 RepID=UPI001F01DF5C|nr:pyridoxine 5'-phosphate synthase [Rhizobium sp. SL42]UJW77623.1 pyridoxine 5'-phosphate synthase [Rhizobium sp. SL42]
MKTSLSVNVNAIAFLRNRRNLPWPSVEGLAKLALESGADGITIHPRPDERHIRRDDVQVLERLLRLNFPDREYNIEGYPSDDFLDLVCRTKPDQVTFVPDTPDQSTSDHGWDVIANADLLQAATERVKKHGIRVSFFIDEDPDVPALCKAAGADRIEIYTAPYGSAFTSEAIQLHLENLQNTAGAATRAGLQVNAGHDLTLQNLPALKSAIPQLAEVSIGHALISDALALGLPATIKAYGEALRTKEG